MKKRLAVKSTNNLSLEEEQNVDNSSSRGDEGGTMGRMHLILLVEKLERLLEKAVPFPLTTKTLIDREEGLELLGEIRANIPKEIEKAEWIVKESDKILKEAQQEAQDVVKKAKEYVGKSINESDIISQAKSEAKEIVNEAKGFSKEMQREADKYADETLTRLENTLKKTMKVIDEGRKTISNRSEE